MKKRIEKNLKEKNPNMGKKDYIIQENSIVNPRIDIMENDTNLSTLGVRCMRSGDQDHCIKTEQREAFSQETIVNWKKRSSKRRGNLTLFGVLALEEV